MNPVRWRQIDQLLQGALELMPDERDAFLENASSGDEDLKKEVQSLLASAEQGSGLIDSPAFEVAASLLAEHIPELNPGGLLGHYRIASFLGAGGMGEVYLAKDEKLNRPVALKLLPAEYTRHPERPRRLEHEAQAASALNHPNILTIYEIGQIDDRRFIATEFVEGETVRERLKKRGLTLPQALDIAIQICGALDAAHQAGIVHRDIKPENIMLRPDGYVKVVDFGLAKLTDQQDQAAQSQTVDGVDISSGLVMGTVKYMSPEQARGEKVDARSDIFSLGVVLYEMITRHAPFEGETTTDLVAKILKREPPPLAQYSSDVSDSLQKIISKALSKDRTQRYQTINDFLSDLRRLGEELNLGTKFHYLPRAELNSTAALPSEARTTTPSTISVLTSSARYAVEKIKGHKMRTAFALVTISVVTTAIGYLVYRSLIARQAAIQFDDVRLSRITTSGQAANAAISPDGSLVAYVAIEGGNRSIWLRQVDNNSTSQIVPPREASYWGLSFSPDGGHLYFFGSSKDEPDPSLYQMAASGGAPKKLIAGVENSNGNNTISFSPDGSKLAFVREYASGETALVTTNADGTNEQKLATRNQPAFLGSAAWSPDGKTIACVVGNSDSKGAYSDLVEVGVIDRAERPITAQRWKWISDLIWLSDGSGLLITAHEREGEGIQILEVPSGSGRIRRITTDLNVYSGLSLTHDSSALVTTQNNKVMNIWTQPSGDSLANKQITTGVATKDGWDGIAWTHDGKIVYSSHAGGKPDIWIMDRDGGSQKQLTYGLGSDSFGLSLSQDGRFILFVSQNSGRPHIWRVDTDGNNPKQLTNGNGELNPFCSPDSKWVYFTSEGKQWKVSIDGGDPVLLTGPSADVIGFSPDGNWIAYLTSGDQNEERKIGILSTQNEQPLMSLSVPPTNLLRRMQWSPDSRALGYINNRGGVSNIWTQQIDGSPPKRLTDFKTHFIHCFAWSRDGQQLALARWTNTSDVVLIRNFR